MTAPTERIAPDEKDRFEAYATELRQLARKRARGGPAERALHVKRHVGAVAALAVPELPAHLRVGPFASPRTFPAYVRYSNGTGARQHDGAPDVRGVAIKLVGVPGRKIIPGLEEAKTQDFLFIQTPATAVRDPGEFLTLIRAVAKGKALLVPRLILGLGPLRTLSVLKGFATMPKVASMATARFYTAAPLRFGDSAAKLAIFPEAQGGAPAAGRDGLRDELAARLKAGPISYALKVQLFVDEATTPIEDNSVEWPEGRSPWLDLGRLTLPAQEVASERGRQIEQVVESLSFDPWHAVPELRPMGAMMRARAAAYRESVIERKAAPEPGEVLSIAP
jgi:catalase